MQPEHKPSATSQPGVLTVTCPAIFAAGQQERTAEFVRRVLSVPAVRAIEIDPVRATAMVRYRAFLQSDASIVARIVAAAGSTEPAPDCPLPPWHPESPVAFYRDRDIVSTLDILLMSDRRLRVHHPMFSHDPVVAGRIEDALRHTPGVRDAALNIPAATLDIRVDPGLTDSISLLRRVEMMIMDPPEQPRAPGPGPAKYGTALVGLAAAGAGDLVTPFALPLAGAWMVLMNVGTFRAAGRQLRRRRLGLPVLYSTIVVMTLLSGSFLSAAVMFFSFRYWERRHRHNMADENAALLAEIHTLPETGSVIEIDGSTRAVESAEIEPGMRVRVSAGDIVPVDATVVSGAALIETGVLGGGRRARLRGDPVQAGGVVIAGELDLAVVRSGHRTRISEFAHAVLASTVPSPSVWTLTPGAERFAGKTVAPTLAVAAVGLAVGGPAMANAVLRPDYATGVGMTDPLHILRANRTAMRHGAVVRRPDALGRLAAGNWVVIDDHDGLCRPACEVGEIQVRGVSEDHLLPAIAAAGAWLGDARAGALARACARRGLVVRQFPLASFDETGLAIQYGPQLVRLRSPAGWGHRAALRVEVDGVEAARVDFRGTGEIAAADIVRTLRADGRRVFLASAADEDIAAERAARIGADAHAGGMNDHTLCVLLRALHDRGMDVIHVRNGPALPHARDQYVSIALAGPEGVRHEADVLLCGDTIDPLPALLALAAEARHHNMLDRGIVTGLNIGAVAGVFTLGFSGLTVVLLNNVVNYIMQERARRALSATKVRHGRGIAGEAGLEHVARARPAPIVIEGYNRQREEAVA